MTEWGSNRVFWTTLTELSFLLVFVFLFITAATARQSANQNEELRELRQYRVEVEKILQDLHIDLEELRRVSNVLVPSEFLKAERASLLGYLEYLKRENERLAALASADIEIRQLESRLQKLRQEVQVAATGTEPGSCWFDPNGRLQFLFEVVIRDEGLSLEGVWPDSRKQVVEDLGLDWSRFERRSLSNTEFSSISLPIYQHSRENHCRFFVALRDGTSNKEAYKGQRRLVERFFFVQEVV